MLGMPTALEEKYSRPSAKSKEQRNKGIPSAGVLNNSRNHLKNHYSNGSWLAQLSIKIMIIKPNCLMCMH
jgi:hypothetical protein